jgi:hypothetical protein
MNPELFVIALWAMAYIICQIWNPPDPARQFVLVLILVLIFISMWSPFFLPAFRAR